MIQKVRQLSILRSFQGGGGGEEPTSLIVSSRVKLDVRSILRISSHMKLIEQRNVQDFSLEKFSGGWWRWGHLIIVSLQVHTFDSETSILSLC